MTRFSDIPWFQQRFTWIGVLPSILVGIACTLRFVQSSDVKTLSSSAALILLAIGWSFWFRSYLKNKARDILIKTRGLTCTSCGYCLVGMDENGACPECGQSYYADHLTDVWSKAAGFPPSSP